MHGIRSDSVLSYIRAGNTIYFPPFSLSFEGGPSYLFTFFFFSGNEPFIIFPFFPFSCPLAITSFFSFFAFDESE